jgi:hypothetical protein
VDKELACVVDDSRYCWSGSGDWAPKETYDAVIAIVREHSGAYGIGVDYAVTHVHKGPERVKHGQRIGPNPAKT